MLPPPSPTLSSPPNACNCRVVFGGAPAGAEPALRVALPLLAGDAEECLLRDAAPPENRNGLTLFRAPAHLAGFAAAAPGLGLEAAALDLYARLLDVTRGLHLYRVWNYIPRINAVESGLENYRRFCRGRSLAFERGFGAGFERRLPAASGVGSAPGPLALAFLAGEREPRHFENPRQVPAFQYPPEYGPRPPSFSRATLAPAPGGGTHLFISGTAAILGHATVGAGHLDRQLDGTCENLRAIGETAGAGTDLAAAAASHRAFKVYLRHAADLPRIQAHLDRALLRPRDTVSYLHADLCRADLLVEIEAVLTLSAPSPFVT